MKTLLFSAFLVLAACSPQPATSQGTLPELDGAFDFARLEIINDSGETLAFDVYLAQTDEQRQRGLMFVRSMPEQTGMLFVYNEDDVHSMWMKNTYIPLDMVFALGDGRVSSVIRDAVPLSLKSLASKEPVRYVLELNAGTARRFEIGQNSRIIWNDN
jgi:uncharacterized protein